jgi:hypothetical protein
MKNLTFAIILITITFAVSCSKEEILKQDLLMNENLLNSSSNNRGVSDKELSNFVHLRVPDEMSEEVRLWKKIKSEIRNIKDITTPEGHKGKLLFIVDRNNNLSIMAEKALVNAGLPIDILLNPIDNAICRKYRACVRAEGCYDKSTDLGVALCAFDCLMEHTIGLVCLTCC